MIIMLLGKSGAGKTYIAEKMEKYIKDSFIIDGDDLRNETDNKDLSKEGRTANMHLGLSRARHLSDLGFTVFVAMQAPIKSIREQYLNEYDVQVIVQNNGKNPKDELGYNKNFNPEYDNIESYSLQDFSAEDFYDRFIPKVLVPARFQGFHKGHKVIMEEAKRISPNITIALRVDDGDIIDLDKNIKLLESKGYNVIKTPKITEDWDTLSEEYDIYVQGNPVVIKKFNSNIKLHFVPRYGKVSGTKIRKDIDNMGYNVDDDVQKLIKESI